MKKPVGVFEIDQREIHMVGTRVGVCWNLEMKEIQVKTEDGLATGWMPKRIGKPYIDFLTIRKEEGTGTYYKDEDSPVACGLSLEEASAVLQELADAIFYLDQTIRAIVVSEDKTITLQR